MQSCCEVLPTNHIATLAITNPNVFMSETSFALSFFGQWKKGKGL